MIKEHVWTALWLNQTNQISIQMPKERLVSNWSVKAISKWSTLRTLVLTNAETVELTRSQMRLEGSAKTLHAPRLMICLTEPDSVCHVQRQLVMLLARTITASQMKLAEHARF